jgi:bifunctional DNA-binding transcriptional regulator/antitoxin component of YhaV-PrlF toxin-antitoxin module
MPNEDDETIIIVPELRIIRLVPTPSEALTNTPNLLHLACSSPVKLFNYKGMSIVRVKNKYQVVIPESVREEIGVEIGDVLEAKVERGKITFTPKSIVDRIPQVVKDVRAQAKREGVNKISMEEIDVEVAAVRSGQGKKRMNDRRAS